MISGLPVSTLLQSLLVAVTGIAAESVGMAPREHPIQLRSEQSPGGVRIVVAGQWPVDLRVTYRLEVSSGSSGNRSTQTGFTTLRPGPEVRILDVRLNGAATGWTAKLIVEPEGAAAYEDRIDALSRGR